MIDSCRLPCRIRVDTVWKIGKGGGSTDKKGGGERRLRVTSNPGGTELQKENVRAAFLSPLRRSPPKSLSARKTISRHEQKFFFLQVKFPHKFRDERFFPPFPSLRGYCFYPAIRFYAGQYDVARRLLSAIGR